MFNKPGDFVVMFAAYLMQRGADYYTILEGLEDFMTEMGLTIHPDLAIMIGMLGMKVQDGKVLIYGCEGTA